MNKHSKVYVKGVNCGLIFLASPQSLFPRKRSVIFQLKLKNDKLIKNDECSVIYYNKMTEIERILNDVMALMNIYDADPLRHNDDEYRHHIVI